MISPLILEFRRKRCVIFFVEKSAFKIRTALNVLYNYRMINCQGPCLIHCYKKNSIILIIIGIFIGFLISVLLNKKQVKSEHFNSEKD